MRIDAGISQTNIQQRQPTSSATSVATHVTNNAQESTDEAQAIEKVDFTNMTSKELADWINQEIDAGRMTVDESTPFVGMTLLGRLVDGEYDFSLDDTKQRNFVDLVNNNIDRAKSEKYYDELAFWTSALEIMQVYQIKPGSLDVRA